MENKSRQVLRKTLSAVSMEEARHVFDVWIKKLLPIGRTVNVQQSENQKSGSSRQKTINADAVFLAWQETPSKEFIALYNITEQQHPLYRSTVSEKTLRQHNLNVPETPFPPGKLKRFDIEK